MILREAVVGLRARSDVGAFNLGAVDVDDAAIIEEHAKGQRVRDGSGQLEGASCKRYRAVAENRNGIGQ